MNTIANTTDAIAHDDSPKCYRLGRAYLFLGIFSTVLFLAMGVFSVATVYRNVDGSFARPKLEALIFGVSWLCITLLGIWMIVAYSRTRLLVSAQAITQQGCIGRTIIELRNVTQIVWRSSPVGGTVIIRSRLSKIKIRLANFTRTERDELSDFFHDTFDDHIQKGWPRFVAWCYGHTSTAKQQAMVGAVTLIVVSLATAVVSVHGWATGKGTLFLVATLFSTLTAAGLLWGIRALRKQASNESSG